MLICPKCSEELSDKSPPACKNCDWNGVSHHGIPDYLSSYEFNNSVLRDYLDHYDHIARDDLDNGIVSERYVKNQAVNLIDFLGDVSEADVADIGCGKGYLVGELLRKGAARVTAIDIALPYLARFVDSPRVNPVRANSENLPFKNEFDVIVSTDVMEHVFNLGSFLYSVNRALKQGGKVCIRVPYRENLLAYSLHLGCPYPFAHLRGFNRRLLKDYMTGAGFTVKRFALHGFGFGMPQPLWTRGRLRTRLYRFIKDWAESKMEHPADVTKWKSSYARLLMRPNTISVIGYKKFKIQPRSSGGFDLV
jgi:SAM-dependent methyltransferase